MLRSGGHAVDAAIAANAVLSVVMGHACGLGGDAFWLIWDSSAPPNGRLIGLNGSGRAPRLLDAKTLHRRGLSSVPLRGPLSITVPGAVSSWAEAHQAYGKLPRSVVLGPAIELARGGFAAWAEYSETVEATAPLVFDWFGPHSAWAAVHRPHGRRWRLGERVRLPALGRTLETIATSGWEDFYDGELGDLQARGLSSAGAAITVQDLREHKSSWVEPLISTYRSVELATPPPNSSGVVALELMNILEQFAPPQRRQFSPVRGPTTDWAHLLIEASKLALDDRDEHVSDPDFGPVPTARLVSKEHARQRAALINPRRASMFWRPTKTNPGGTVFVGAVDDDGNAVGLLQSNFMDFGSGVLDRSTGILYQNRGSYFSLDRLHANVLAPGKRTLHTLIPLMLFRDGVPWMVMGSMGGDAQPAICAQVVSSLVDGGLDAGAAIGAPRCAAEPVAPLSRTIQVPAEGRLRGATLKELASMGHDIVRTRSFDSRLGQCHAIAFVDGGPRAGGSVLAATDPRSAGMPAVW